LPNAKPRSNVSPWPGVPVEGEEAAEGETVGEIEEPEEEEEELDDSAPSFNRRANAAAMTISSNLTARRSSCDDDR